MYARWIPRWRRAGYNIKLKVPAEVIIRRFGVGWRNFESVYKPLVDCWALYDNSGDRRVLISSEGME